MRTNYTSNGHICFKRTGLHAFSRRKLRLERRPGADSPHAEKTVLEALSFYAWHEPYHLGQLGTLRAQFGLKPTATLAVEASSTV